LLGRTTINIDTYVGSMHQSQIQRDVQGSVQTLTVKELDLEAVGKFVAELEQVLQGSALPAAQLAELQADIATIRAQLASPKPKPSLIREGLLSVRHVLEHAGGKIAATGILAALGTLIGP
jgi:multidrug efflux pump subunit AcrA (membrane-fusion protein)